MQVKPINQSNIKLDFKLSLTVIDFPKKSQNIRNSIGSIKYCITQLIISFQKNYCKKI